jgi:catechol 2,3-dioxygenase
MAIQKVAHVEINVPDVGAALEFHTDTLGLVEIGREGDTAFLGCGLDDTYDLALRGGGGTGLAHVALQVAGDEDLDAYAERLKGMGVDTQSSTNGEPGQGRALRFSAPSGHTFELVPPAEDKPYLQPAMAQHPRSGITPTDLCHVTLRTGDVKGLAEFLVQALDFKISDVFEPGPDVWAAAWTRAGDWHHDIAIIGGGPDETLDHVAFEMDGIDHIRRTADALAQAELPLEAGPGRHGIGGNIYAYFWAPGGNRYELSAEMPRTVNPNAPHNVYNDFPKAFSAWGAMPPESFQKGS